MKKRLDQLLVESGKVATREKGRSLIIANQVLVNDTPCTKPGTLVEETAKIRIRENAEHPYVSRGGLKLAHALDHFKIQVVGKTALDVGASTGGFTDVLLMRDVAKVIALDVGKNQLDWKIRSNPKVRVIEGFNVRYVNREVVPEQIDIVVIDVSFISLDKIIPALKGISHANTEWIALIKPQFEVGKEKVGKGGIVRDDSARKDAIEKVLEFATKAGLVDQGVIESPIQGRDGNTEYLVHWKSHELE